MSSQNQARFGKQIDLGSDPDTLFWATFMKISEESFKG